MSRTKSRINPIEQLLAKQTPDIQRKAKRRWRDLKTGQIVLFSLHWDDRAPAGYELV